MKLIQSVKRAAEKFDINISRYSSFKVLVESKHELQRMKYALDFIKSITDPEAALNLYKAVSHSKSQIAQDLFAIHSASFKSGGYFVEFGAADGVYLSNSYMLEKYYGWGGILAEPARSWHDALRKSRSCNIETDCVWSKTGEKIYFEEVGDAEYSTIHEFKNLDLNSSARQGSRKYPVKTISLMDLLKKYNAPRKIDYLSIDTEGSEFDILSAFDFEAYDVSVITCEHNHTSNQGKIRNLLLNKGYSLVFEGETMFDDWFVRF